jgi:hypothetical protein
LLIALPTAVLVVGGFVEASTTTNDLAADGALMVLLPGLPIWLTALVTPWLSRAKPTNAVAQDLTGS